MTPEVETFELFADDKACLEITRGTFYIGLEETADLFIKIIKDMGLDDTILTKKIDVDGECELIVEVRR